MQSFFLNEIVEFCSVSVLIEVGNIYLKVIYIFMYLIKEEL